MNPERWKQVAQIYVAVVSQAPERRAAAVAGLCGADEGLRRVVESLLDDQPEASFLDSAAVSTTAETLTTAFRTADRAGFQPGALVGGRFLIVSLVGSGGMGDVYRADDLKVGQRVALKFLPSQFAVDSGRMLRLVNEVRLARQISHPNVCRVYDIGEADGRAYLSMEYIDGEDLASLLQRIGRLPHEKVLQVARELCAGLAAAHDQGVLHRDLKPSNIMIDGRGRARIADFGLAVTTENPTSGEIAGTPAYMAPEQVAGGAVTVQTDIFALGLILYELVTGTPLFRGATRQQRSLEGGAAEDLVRSADIHPRIKDVIARCLKQDPAARPTSVWLLAGDLPGGAEELERFFSLSLDLLCVAGFDGYFKRLNSAWELVLGYTLEELLAKPYLEFVHPDDQHVTTTEADRLVGGGRVVTFENRYIAKDGTVRWLQWNAVPFASEQMIYAAARDVTERKQAKDTIARYSRDLKEARLAEAAHASRLARLVSELEVRNLLSVVQAALPASDAARPAAARPPIEVISAIPSWVELEVPCTRESVDQIEQVVARLGADLPEEVVDSVGFAFRELVMNAVEWGGKLDPTHKVRITCVRTDRLLMYRIADPGPGFTFENLQHAAISHPGNPIEHARIRDEQGLRPGGFGLLTVRSMVDELVYNQKQNEVIFIKYLG